VNFVVQYGNNQIMALLNCDDLKTDTIPDVKKIFFCETIEEIIFVMEELRNDRT